MNALSYFAPAFFMFTVHIAVTAFRFDVLSRWLSSTISSQVLDFFVYTMDFIYALMFGNIVFFSLHFKNTDKNFKSYLYLISTTFGLFMLVVIGVLLVDVIRGLVNSSSCNLLFI